MARMTGGQALVASLSREGVRVIFGLPGVQLYGAMAALRTEPRIRFVATRHEQATSYMADGYARAGGGFGTALVVPGPGLLNASAGLSTAYAASSPVLVVAGQIPRSRIGRNVGLLHEVDDQLQVHDEPGDVPGLQGAQPGGGQVLPLMRGSLSPTARLATVLGGTLLALWGLRRLDAAGVPVATIGMALLARGVGSPRFADLVDDLRRAFPR